VLQQSEFERSLNDEPPTGQRRTSGFLAIGRVKTVVLLFKGSKPIVQLNIELSFIDIPPFLSSTLSRMNYSSGCTASVGSNYLDNLFRADVSPTTTQN